MTWELLLSASVNLILTRFEIKEGILLIDDTGKKRSFVPKRIPYVHYFKDKQGTGTNRYQEIVLLSQSDGFDYNTSLLRILPT